METLKKWFPLLVFQIKTDKLFEKKRYIVDNGGSMFLVKSMGLNQHNVLTLCIESEYINNKKILYKDYEIFMGRDNLNHLKIYEMVPQQVKIQDNMERRALEKIISTIIDEHFML